MIVNLDPDNDPALLREVIKLCRTILEGDDAGNARLLATHLDRGPKHAADFVNMTAGLAVSSIMGRHADMGERVAVYETHITFLAMLEALDAMIASNAE